MEKKYYAIVRSSYWKYRKRFMFPTIGGHLPIYWNKKVAEDMCTSINDGNKIQY